MVGESTGGTCFNSNKGEMKPANREVTNKRDGADAPAEGDAEQVAGPGNLKGRATALSRPESEG